MSKAKKLSDYEKGKIDQLISLQWSQRKIAKEISRSKTVIQHYMVSRDFLNDKSQVGRPKVIGKRTKKKILNLACNKIISCKRIKEKLGLSVSKHSVWRTIRSNKNLKYTKIMSKPPLTANHKKVRFDFSLKHYRWNEEWGNIVFSDEKKFNLDGPDGFHFYWHDINTDDITMSKRVQGGGSVMVWAGFTKKHKTPLQFVSTRMNSESYCTMLENVLIPFFHENDQNSYIFQQDNATCHRAKNTQKWFLENNIACLEWPSRSPDLNPIENLWGILARKVYANGRQFDHVDQLKNAILKEWNDISTVTLENLINSMPNRMEDLAKTCGSSINY